MKKTLKIMFFVVVAIIYLNIGHEYSMTAQKIIENKSPNTFLEYVIGGGFQIIYKSVHQNEFGWFNHVSTMIVWPVILIMALFFWFIFLCWQIILLLWAGIQFLWWFIFCGGLYKSVGIQGIGIIILIISSFAAYKFILAAKKFRAPDS